MDIELSVTKTCKQLTRLFERYKLEGDHPYVFAAIKVLCDGIEVRATRKGSGTIDPTLQENIANVLYASGVHCGLIDDNDMKDAKGTVEKQLELFEERFLKLYGSRP